MQIKESLKTVGNVISKIKYFLLFFLISFIFFSFGVLPKNIELLFSLIGNTTFPKYFVLVVLLYYEWFKNTQILSQIVFITISLLVGITISLLIFKIRSRKIFAKSTAASSSIGVMLGILVPVCLPCGIGLVSLLGLSSVLLFLPYQGLEIGIISIILLVYSIIAMGKDINNCKSCQIEIKGK